MKRYWSMAAVLSFLISATFVLGNEPAKSITADRSCRWIQVDSSPPRRPYTSHGRGSDWLEQEYLLADIQMSEVSAEDHSPPADSPVVYRVLACKIVSPSGPVTLEPARNLNSVRDPNWILIGAANPPINSHQRLPIWLPDGSFITQIDLDSTDTIGRGGAFDGPIIGAVRRAYVPGYKWQECFWEPLNARTFNYGRTYVGRRYSYDDTGQIEANGFYITQIDLDTQGPNMDDPDGNRSPIIGSVRVCSLEAQSSNVEDVLSPAQQRELLDAHNRYRQEVGVPLLRWSNSLATSAQSWAEQVANRHQDGSGITRSDHSSGGGENIWQGSLGGYSLTAMVDDWGSEKENFRYGVFDLLESGSAISTTGNWVDVGHYTQIVWRNTQEVGSYKGRFFTIRKN